ncbi:MAG: DUF4476 domain-containing protein [Cyclobacteriaceae bacterium]|nr:DUF4476 domain-containing protein [Cyclobacteriaceae bacterium]
MKPLLILLITLSALTPSSAQDCPNPMGNIAFQSAFNLVAAQSTPQKKLEQALALAGKNCLTSSQVKNVCVLLSDDASRLEFGKAAWNSTFDRVNFFDVYDAFGSLSFALRLYDYTQHAGVQERRATPTPVVAVPESSKESLKVMKFPAILYPTHLKYTGKKGCDGPVIDESGFAMMASGIFGQPTDETRYVAIQAAVQQRCFSMAHLMKVCSLIGDESMRFKALADAFSRVHDLEHHGAAKALFSSAALQNDWVQFATTYLTPPPPVCQVTDEDLKTVLRSLQSKNFPDEKLNLLKTIRVSKCFSTGQVRTITKEFSFDQNKLDAMKLLFEKCTDQSNYYTLGDELNFVYLRDDLNEFIRKGGK